MFPIEFIEIYVKRVHTTYINSKIDEVATILQQQHEEIEDQLEQHNTNVESELASNQDDTAAKLDSLDTKQDELNMKLMSVSSELEQNILSNITEELKQTSHGLHQSLRHICGGEGGWRPVVYLDMTQPSTHCPNGWQLTTHSKRTCGKVSGTLSCDSVFFSVTGGKYNRVCGHIRAYQYGFTDAFEAFDEGRATTIDEAYVAGVSLTHGTPREHIWTFAAGATEERPFY